MVFVFVFKAFHPLAYLGVGVILLHVFEDRSRWRGVLVFFFLVVPLVVAWEHGFQELLVLGRPRAHRQFADENLVVADFFGLAANTERAGTVAVATLSQ